MVIRFLLRMSTATFCQITLAIVSYYHDIILIQILACLRVLHPTLVGADAQDVHFTYVCSRSMTVYASAFVPGAQRLAMVNIPS